MDIYAGPAPDYAMAAEVPEGVPLTVMGCVEGYSWCDVAAPDLRGWVYGGSLSYPYRGANVPVMTYGVQIGLPVVVFSVDSYWGHHYRGRSSTMRRAGQITRLRRVEARRRLAVRSVDRRDRRAVVMLRMVGLRKLLRSVAAFLSRGFSLRLCRSLVFSQGKALLVRWMHRKCTAATLWPRSAAAKRAVEKHAAAMNAKTVQITIRLCSDFHERS
ncbi:SH3 domain-containing protein [Paraburkholderia dipogonis]|uniref:SH3 domain-containing protein n=1 Tax=Paraburkholderia dipogonis TaxID=1211383 RepID=UPI0038B896DF